MGSYEALVYKDSELIKPIQIKDNTTLIEIRNLCKIQKKQDNCNYYFISKNGDIIKDDSNFTAKDIRQDSNNGYKIKLKSVPISYNTNIYIDGAFKTNIKVTSKTPLTDIRKQCNSYFKNDEEYYFILNNSNRAEDRIVKNDSSFIAEDVWINIGQEQYKIDMKSNQIIYRAHIYIDNELKILIDVTKTTKLENIRQNIEKQSAIFQNTSNYYFISINGEMIRNDSNFIVKDVWQKIGDNEYKIYLRSEEVSMIVSLYLNGFKKSGIQIKNSMNLLEIKKIAGQEINNDNVYFLTKDKALIEQENLENFKAKDVIIFDDNNNARIDLNDKNFYKRQVVIEYLRKLEEQASSGAIDWVSQTEFFKKMEDFAGTGISNALKDELLGKYENQEKVKDKEYLHKFLILLLKQDDIMKNAQQKNYEI